MMRAASLARARGGVRTLCSAKPGAGNAAKPPPTGNHGKFKREESNTKKNWLSDKGTYPVIGVIVGAVGLVTFILGKKASSDVSFNKVNRTTLDYLENERGGGRR